MNARAFYEKVKELRSAQRKVEYFAKEPNAEPSLLTYWSNQKASLEKEIDDEITRVEGILRQQEKDNHNIKRAIKLLNDKGFELEQVKQQTDD